MENKYSINVAYISFNISFLYISLYLILLHISLKSNAVSHQTVKIVKKTLIYFQLTISIMYTVDLLHNIINPIAIYL